MKLDHGKFSENILYAACVNIFGKDVVFLSPNVVSETGKQQELTDVLVILDSYLITIQSKSLELSISELDDIKFGRIVKKYEDAKRQIDRTINAFNRKANVVLKTCFGKEFSLPWENIKTIISIITLNVNDDDYTDSEIRFQFPLKVEYYKTTILHTFILRDFYTMVCELTTGGDFLNYLNERAYLSTRIIENYTNELDILALFVSQYDLIETIHKQNDVRISIGPEIWEEYRKNNAEIIKQRDKQKFAVGIFELIIQELRRSMDYTMSIHGQSTQEFVSNYFHLIGFFSLFGRAEEIVLTKKFWEKYELTQDYFQRYFLFRKDDTGFLMLITNETNRNERKSELIRLMGYASKYIIHDTCLNGIKYVTGIATEGKQLTGRSLDIVSVDIDTAINFIGDDNNKTMFKEPQIETIDEWSVTGVNKMPDDHRNV